MDLAVFDMDNDKYIGALFMIVPFTKWGAATPFETKQPDAILRCIKDCMRQMGGLPETVYSDMEGSFSSREVQNYFKNNKMVVYEHACRLCGTPNQNNQPICL